MERTIITISESGNVNIPDGDVWMSFAELVGLFDVVAPILKTSIQAIHKSGVIAEHTQHCEVMPYTYWATLYNMDMIATLAFRINSYGAETVIHGNAAYVVLAIVLAERFIVPRDTLLHISATQFRLLHNFVERCSHSDKFFFCHTTI